MENPIQLIKGADGVYTMTYFGKMVGWIQPSNFLRDGRRKGYRALSIHHDLKHVYSLNMARDWLMSNYH
jgi:hypothetical protein